MREMTPFQIATCVYNTYITFRQLRVNFHYTVELIKKKQVILFLGLAEDELFPKSYGRSKD